MGALYDFKLVSGPCEVREYPSGTTGVYDAGEVVGLSSGALVIGADNLCMGVALEDAVTSGHTKIIVITPEQTWSCGYNGTTAESMLGLNYLVTFTHDAQCVSSTTSTPTITVVGLHPNDGAKEYGRLLVRFCVAVCQATGLVLNA